jgi:hypothetical protein
MMASTPPRNFTCRTSPTPPVDRLHERRTDCHPGDVSIRTQKSSRQINSGVIGRLSPRTSSRDVTMSANFEQRRRSLARQSRSRGRHPQNSSGWNRSRSTPRDYRHPEPPREKVSSGGAAALPCR